MMSFLINPYKFVSPTPPSPPIITPSPSFIIFPNTSVGDSVSQIVSVSGTNLIGNISVTSNSIFELSTNGLIWGDFLTLNQYGGNVSTSIFVRFTPIEPIPYLFSIEFSSPSATSQYVIVSGDGI